MLKTFLLKFQSKQNIKYYLHDFKRYLMISVPGKLGQTKSSLYHSLYVINQVAMATSQLEAFLTFDDNIRQ